ncbi:MAG: small multi-drug export protein, partial [Candidatus Marinimicrobia bacterium]|nr:small multi-drug export protein [Candidatus Neomarinimicrobiota bacterium]
RRKVESKVEKYGEFGLALFIGIPLPGSGVYTGALAAFILGLDFKKFFIATVIGVFIAGILVTIATLTGMEFLEFMLKTR